MGAILYDAVTGFVYGTGDLEDPQDPNMVFVANFPNEDFVTPPMWYVGALWFWFSDEKVRWYQEGTPEPQKPFDIDDAKDRIEAIEAENEDCEIDRASLHTDVDGAISVNNTQNSTLSTHAGQISSLQSSVASILASRHPAEYISGFSWIYDSTDTSRIILDTGFARNDANTVDIVLSSQVYVDLDLSGAGGIDTGTKAANSVYFLWVISKADGTTNGMFSLSASSPTMPSGYVNKRLVGFIYTLTGSAAVQPFNVKGFSIDVEVSQLENQISGSTTAANASLAATRISPSLSRMPYVFGVITSTLSLLGQRAYILTKSAGAQVTSTPAGVIASVFANTIPLDSSRNAWYGSTALGLGAALVLQGGVFSRRI